MIGKRTLVGRRRALTGLAAGAGAAAFLAACGSGADTKETSKATVAAPSPAGGASAAQATATGNSAALAQWEQVVAAAKKEGRVAVNTFPGDGFNRALRSFNQAYPEIKLEQTNLHSQDYAPRIIQERKAGVYTWDVAIIPTSTALQVLKPEGVWEPIKPAIIHPDALDDKNWEKGFEYGFLDKDKLSYAFTANRAASLRINTDMVKEDEIKSVRDLLNPKWKGKLLLADVRTMGDTFWPMTAARLKLGDDIVKQLFVDQEPTLSRDTRQITEFMVRGRFPIAMGVSSVVLKDFEKQGLGKNLKLTFLPEIDYQSTGSSGTMWLLSKAPHPNAARVFINWLLTKDAQIPWAKEVETNSRRVGVEPGNPDTVVPRSADPLRIDSEEMLPEIVKTQDIAKALIK